MKTRILHEGIRDFNRRFPHQCCVTPPAVVPPGSWSNPRPHASQVEELPDKTRVRRWGFYHEADMLSFKHAYAQYVVEVDDV